MTDEQRPDFFTDLGVLIDPYPYIDELRSECPVLREPYHDVVMVTGYDEAMQVYRDRDSFSSCISVTGPFPGFPVPLAGKSKEEIDALIEEHRDSLPMSDQLPTLDPPMHTNHRALLARLLTPKRLRENEEFIASLVRQTLDTIIGRGQCEFVSDFAGPLAMLVVADLLGVPEEDHDDFRAALLDSNSDEAGKTRAVGSTKGETMELNPLGFLYDRFTKYVEDRRADPRDDVLTGLATATFPDGTLPPALDPVRVASNLFAAGQETTVRMLTSGVLFLAEDPDLQRRLRKEPELVPNFVEETLRMESPVKGDFRLSRCPVTIGDTEIPEGTTLMVLNGGANHDSRHFEDPHTFDVDRENAHDQLAFGRGMHACPGGPLARAEGRLGFGQLLERTSDIRISEEHHGPPGNRKFRYVPTFILRGLTRLHIEFDPA